ncbi:MAG: diphthamide biosynthesis enzyme Dph2 [Archaeoglobaceae archaeon]
MRVAIQLPDGLKVKALEIAKEWMEKGYEVVISGDSCFGACDVDFRLLEHADMLVHYAHTPIIEDDRIVYVPYPVDYDPHIDFEFAERRLLLAATAQYCHRLREVKEHLESKGYEVLLRRGDARVKLEGQVLGCNYSALRGEADAVLLISDGVFHAKGAALYTGKKVYAYNPLTRELEVVTAENFVRERYVQIARCYGKRKVGVLLSKKPGQRRETLAFELAKLARERGFEAFVVSIDDVTTEKLANLPFEFYVNTACPRVTYDDYRNFSKPIISPQEFRLLLGLDGELKLDEITIV